MKNNYYYLYYFFDNILIRFLRVAVFLIIGIAVYYNSGNLLFILTLLPFYFILILQEFFIHFKLGGGVPSKKLSDNYAHPIECADFKIRARLERNTSVQHVIKEIKNDSEIRYFNGFLDYELPKETDTISEEELLKEAAEIVLKVTGKYIHGIDIYAAYLLLQDRKNKTLFEKDITEKDIIIVLSWTRKQFEMDSKRRKELLFSGSGVFDFFVYGWSAQIARYASNFTREVLMQKRLKPIGRDREYDLLITALSKNASSNALIVGDAGIGKTELVSQFVEDSNENLLPKNITNKIVFKLYAERLLAGIGNQGDLESRFVELFEELMHAGNIIVYIPNIENIFGGGGVNIDISGVMVEYLRNGRIKIIGSCTKSAFETFIYPKQEIKELFDIVEIEEPDPDTALFMLFEKAKELEHYNHVRICYSALKEAGVLSDLYNNDGTALPGRAIRLLDDVVAYCRTHGTKKILKNDVQKFVQEKTKIILDKPTEKESAILLNLEQEIHKRIISQDEAVVAISDAMRRVRSGMKNEKRPIASFLFLGPTGVGKTQTAKALAKSYFGDEDAMISVDMSEYQTPDAVNRLLGNNAGQYEETVLDKVVSNPFTMILLDEFEKAYPKILDLFLQVFDEGRLTDNRGRTVSFNNTIIIATSNAGSEFIREKYKEHVAIEEVKKELTEKILQQNIFRPELLNRLDDVIVFKPLSESDVVEVAKLFLQEVIDKISEQQISLSYENGVPEFVAKNSYSVEFGARNVRRFIEQAIENQLSKLILSDAIQHGSSASIRVENNALVIKS